MKRLLIIPILILVYFHVVTGCQPPKYTRVKSPVLCSIKKLQKCDAGKFDEAMEHRLRKLYKGK